MIGSSMSGPRLKGFLGIKSRSSYGRTKVEIGQFRIRTSASDPQFPVFLLKVSAKSSSKATLANARRARHQISIRFELWPLNELSTHPSRNPAVLLSAQAGFFGPLQDGVNPGQATHLQFLSQFENGSRRLPTDSLGRDACVQLSSSSGFLSGPVYRF